MRTFPILLSGIKHCGKSSLGELAARRLGIDFFDTDEVIKETLSNEYPEISLRDLYIQHGAEAFYDLEYRSTMGLLRSLSQEDWHIISLGGGMCDNPMLLRALAGTHHIIYLFQPEEILLSRILRNGIPPFLDSDDPEGSFRSLFIRRDGRYRSVAKQVIELEPEGTLETNAELLLETIRICMASNRQDGQIGKSPSPKPTTSPEE